MNSADSILYKYAEPSADSRTTAPWPQNSRRSAKHLRFLLWYIAFADLSTKKLRAS